MKQTPTPNAIPALQHLLRLGWSFLFVFGGIGFLRAQTSFESLLTQPGLNLTQGMVYDILQDKEGFLWLGTKDGLYRYDGYTLKIFANDIYDSYSLSGNTVVKLFEDSKGHLWIISENNGLNVYHKASGRFYHLQHRPGDPHGLSSNQIRCIAEDAAGNILAAANEADLNVITLPSGFFSQKQAPLIRKVTLPQKLNLSGMAKDSRGRLWLGGSDHFLYQWKSKELKLEKVVAGFSFIQAHADQEGNLWATDQQNPPFLWDGKKAVPIFADLNQVTELQTAPSGSLWLIKGKSVYEINLQHWDRKKPLQWQKQTLLTETEAPIDVKANLKKGIVVEPKLLALNAKTPLMALNVDRAGNVAIGTFEYGLYQLNPNIRKFEQVANGLGVRQIIPAADGSIHLSTFQNEWFRVKEGQAPEALHWPAEIGAVSNELLSRSGEYWILTERDLVRFYPGQKAIHLPFPADIYGQKQPMLEDQKGYIWLAGYAGALARIDPKTNQIKTYNFSDAAKPMQAQSLANALYEDQQGLLWIGTREGFVKADFSKAKPQFTWFRQRPFDPNSLSYNYVMSFLDDPIQPKRYLWVCTRSNLNRFDKKTGDFLHLGTREGLPNKVIYGLLADPQGNLWGSTNRGIFCLSQKKSSQSPAYTFHNFSAMDGLQDDEFNTGAFALLPDGRMAFGGVNGFNVFDPQTVLAPDYHPKVLLTNLLVNNVPVLPGDQSKVLQTTIETTPKIKLQHQQDLLTLEYAALDYTASPYNKYRYQLEGADPAWVEAGTRRSVTYLHLPAGNYTFKVQGSNGHGIWSPHIASLHLTILPPWWFSTWAYLVYALLLGLIIRAVFKFYLHREKLQAQLAYETRETARIKELDSAKTRLYTNMTHEFRTPLTVILGMAQQTLETPQENLQYKQEMILRNGQHLLQLVNEMLDLSRLESGKMPLHWMQGELIAFLRYIVESFHSLAESQNKQLHFLADVQELHGVYDPEKLRQIVSNLLANALKFTPKHGHIYLSIGLQGEKIQIKVKDMGIGIPAAQLPHVFDRFYQVDDSPTRQSEGAGIGLALTKELVQLLQGEIQVNSPAKGSLKGTEFTVLLPLRQDKELVSSTEVYASTHPSPIHPKLEWPKAPQNPGKPLVLLVEDNPDVVAYIQVCLPEYRLLLAQDGQEGFDLAIEHIPDLIISDVMMPRMDGFTMCQHLKKDERSSHIPIIMLTARVDLESKLTGLEHGAEVYLEKPFHKEELLLRVRKLLELREQLQAHYLKSAGLYTTLRLEEKPLAQREDAFVQKIRECIEENLADPGFSIEQLCKTVHLSQRQLQRKLDALTGFSPNQFIRSIRLQQAKILLRDPDLSITAVAYDCGFSDPSYFARVFKQEFALTPQEWREREWSVLN